MADLDVSRFTDLRDALIEIQRLRIENERLRKELDMAHTLVRGAAWGRNPRDMING